MRKQLIKKGEGGFALLSNQLMQNAGMNYLQPSIYPDWIKKSNNLNNLFDNQIKTSNNLSPFLTSNPDTNKIVSGLNSQLNDKNFQNRMTQGQNDYSKEIKSADSAKKWLNFKTNTSEFAKSDLGKNLIGGVVDGASNLGLAALGKQPDALSGGINTIANVAGNLDYIVPGLGTGIKYGLKALNFADKALGKTTKSFAGNTGLSGYQDFSTQGKQFRVSQTGARRRSEIETLGNKKMFTTAKTNADALLKKQQASIQAIGNTGITNQNQLLGGQNYSVLTAKKGATLQDIRNYIKVRNIEKEVAQNPNLDDNLEKIEVSKFQNGGSLIPSGALHKNKHKIESVNPELDGEITKKGIPVISYAEKGDVLEFENDGKTPKVLAKGGEVIQHAEIEVGEIILNISLTKKLIELMNKGTNDDMIHAGKLLARELMEDTTDNTGLIEKTIGNED